MTGLLTLAAAGWIAFIAPDFPQARSLAKEYEARMAPSLRKHDLEVRFVPVADSLSAPLEPPVAGVLAAKPRLVVAPAQHIALVAKRLSAGSVPIVFSTRADPVRSGLATSLARPGGNATGISYDVDIVEKQLELLRQLVPDARAVGILADDTWLQEEVGRARMQAYERAFGLRLVVLLASSPEHMVQLVASEEGRELDAWLVPIGNYSGRARNEVVAAIRQTRKPAVYGRSFFTDAGGLMSYQEVIANPIEILADMSREVLDGRPAGDIPVRLPREFELVVNFDTARALGLTIPATLLRRAHRIVGAPPSP